jgi:hypothetical protein
VLAHIETLQKQLAEKNVELGEVRQRGSRSSTI